MTFNLSKITFDDCIKVGSDSAPLKVVEYINLRCPDSKEYEENIVPFLDDFIEDGQVQRIIKHFDKGKYGLETGNVLNQYLNYDTPEETYEFIKKLFNEQSIWGSNRLAHIPHVAKEYGLSLQEANKSLADRVLTEVESVNVESIPTIFVGQKAFVETVDLEEFKNTVAEHLK